MTRWWCPDHADRAGRRDSEPYRARWAYSASGSVINVDAREAERARAVERQKHRQAELAARQREREVEGEAMRGMEQALAERHRRELPEGFS